MKSISSTLFYAGVLLTAGVTVAAAQTPKHFRGNACIQAVNAACAAEGWAVGNCATARFTPPNYFGSGNRTGLSLFWGYYAQQFTYAAGSMIGPTMRPLTVSQIGNGASTYNATGRIVAQVPAAPTTATVYLNNTFSIAGFSGTCNVVMRFQGQRYPLP